MTLRDAKALRDEIRAAGLHCTVPLGRGPAGYFARISHGCMDGVEGFTDFHHRAAWRTYRAAVVRARRRARRAQDAALRHVDRRTAMERLVDAACGYRA